MASVVWRKGAGLNKCKLLPAPFQAYLNNTDICFLFCFFCLLYFHAFHFVLYVDMSEIKLNQIQIQLEVAPSPWLSLPLFSAIRLIFRG